MKPEVKNNPVVSTTIEGFTKEFIIAKNKKPNLFNKKPNLFNKKPRLFIKRKYQKRHKLFSDFRYVTGTFKFQKLKFYKKKIQVFKKYYSSYAGLCIKVFNKLMEDSVRKDEFLIERRLDIFLCRNFGGSLDQKRQELLEGKVLVNGRIKSNSYVLQTNDFIY
jgi:ribosomal protein S4